MTVSMAIEFLPLWLMDETDVPEERLQRDQDEKVIDDILDMLDEMEAM